MKITNTTVAIAAALVAVVLALVAWLTYAGKDVSQVVYLVVTLVGLVAGTGVTARQVSKVATKVDAVATTQDRVEHKVNGNLSTLIDKAVANGHDVTTHAAMIDYAAAEIEDKARGL